MKLGEGSTPGPWKAGRFSEMSQWITDNASHPLDFGVAQVYGDDLENITANAQLIAHAPLLVEARDVLASLTDHSEHVLAHIGLPHDDAMLMLALIDSARALLAKLEAKGEKP